MKDEELLVAYREGSEEAFRVLYERHSGRVWAYVRRKISNAEQAGDVFQAIFLKLHRYRAKYDSSRPFITWLFTMCRTVVIDELRAHSHRPTPTEEIEQVANPVVDSLAEAPSLAALPELQQKAIQLRYGEDREFEEIAQLLGTSAPNVRQLISRGVKKLRTLAQKRSADV